MLTKCSLLLTLVFACSLNPIHLVHAQNDNPPGFVSIDCGSTEGSDYREGSTGIYYKSDANLIDSGETKSISASLIRDPTEKYLSTVRSFPQGKKNCYTIQPSLGKGNKYLIRATFMYGNYDSLNQLPTFNLNLGPDTWSTIEFEENVKVVRREIIHVLSSDYIHVCLIKTDTSTPFISALELRPLDNTDSSYTINSGSLQTFNRVDFCSEKPAAVIRYKDDSYDRTWYPGYLSNTVGRSTLLENDIQNDNFRVPKSVLRTACTPNRSSDPLQFFWNSTSTSDEFYIYLYFTEVEKLETNQSRELNIYINGKLINSPQIVPPYLKVYSIYSSSAQTGSTSYTVTIQKTENSTLPPIINALEIFTAKKFSNSGTNETDVSAILNIKSTYKVIRDWQGDPCEPEDFHWDGLKCSYPSSNHPARIISLNLSTSGLTGEIVSSIANLTQLKTLDLSYNDLNGQVPEFLSDLPLSVLNLTGNKFTGPIPAQLLENEKKGILLLSHDDEKKNNKTTPAIVGTVLGLVLFLAAILFIFWILRRRRILRDTVLSKTDNQTQGIISKIERKNRQFTYSEVQDITRNFRRVLGQGGFGKVYHGYIEDTQVAVKMLSASSDQGQVEFETEASLLMSVSHKNVTSLVGYCNEVTNMAIIYEFMANRSLDEHLSGTSCEVLNWEIRLQIALDVAEGLEYLHHGCRPAIIHRDVKTSNILLNEKFRATLGDFGLSKAYPAEGGTHVVTGVAGTPGYIDPEYNTSNRLTEKSDVYSFGVALLEIITGRPALLSNRTPIAIWVNSIVRNGDVKQVLDPRLRGKYEVNSAWKAVELALTCASLTSSGRPSMDRVVLELKDCLVIEMGSQYANSNNTTAMIPTDVESFLVPRPR